MATNMPITRLKTALFNLTVTEDDGSALDITGMTVYFHAAGAGVVDIDKSSPSDGITITDAAAGLAQLQIDPDDTEDVPAGGYFGVPYEFTLADGSDNFELVTGSLQISPNVDVP